jgi:hypothetical protein
MTTLMIRLEHPPPGDRLAIRGFEVERDEDGTWHENARAVKEVARELPEVETRRLGSLPLAEAVRRAMEAGSDPALAVTVGEQLWKLIFDGPVGAWWTGMIEAAGDVPVRTILDIEPTELRALPWELMSSGRGWRVFRDSKRPWVRAKPGWSPFDVLVAPVQMLVVVGENDPGLDVEKELDAIHRCVREKPGSWHVQVITGPTLPELRQCYGDFDPHILHVIGHSGKPDNQVVLRMKPEGQQPWELSVEDVLGLPTPAPRLVVLNCCRTSQAGAAAEPTWTFSDAFLTLGSAAVLTMQGDIRSAASIAFTSRFYTDLVAGKAIDVAAAAARLDVSDLMHNQQDKRTWAFPSLLVGADPDRVLPVEEFLSRAELNTPPYLTAFGGVSTYLDRTNERRMVLRKLDSVDSARMLLLTGQHKDGRSAVMRSTMLTLRMRGRNVVYVDLDDARGGPTDPKLSWLTVLRLIRDAIWEWVPTIPDEPRRKFTHDLGFLLDQRDPQPYPDDFIEPEDEAEFRSEGENYREWIAKIVVAFRRMLVAAAREHPLLLAVDSLSAIHDEDLRDVLAEQLLLPLTIGWSRDRLDADVRCLVATSADELRMIPEDFRRTLQQTDVRIKPFRREEVPRLVGEYIARRNLHPPEDWRTRAEGLIKDKVDEVFPPGNLAKALRNLEDLIP